MPDKKLQALEGRVVRSGLDATAQRVCVSLGLLLSACASQAPSHARNAPLHSSTSPAYVAMAHEAIATSIHTWPISGEAVKVVLSAPERAGTVPLVVYVPGLGEPGEAGEHWRTAWSTSGYAVMSVQPLVADATAWASDLARAGDFSTLGHQRYAGEAMRRRLDVLAQVLVEAQRRSAAGDAAWQRVDWNRVVVAGFDLGAYTAMTIAGERGQEAEAASPRMKILAAIAISPFASASPGSSVKRYGGIVVPVLSVTSDADGDPLGIVADPRQRSTPFDRMSGPDKYLLSLNGVAHSMLSGNPDRPAHGSANARPAQENASKAGGDNGRQRGGGGRRRSSADSTQSEARDRTDADDDASGGPLSAKASQARMLVAQDVTTAFLDAYAKGDLRAREWLSGVSGEASGALGGAGQLRLK